jgi:thiopeptide-type bacteriocin biosynthesis protein
VTDLAVEHPIAHIQARLDMGWLLPHVRRIESLAAVRRHLCFTANTAAYEHNGRVYVTEPATRWRSATDGLKAAPLSLRMTDAVRALTCALRPIAYDELIRALLAALPHATSAQVAGLIDTLWQQSLLMTDLGPTLTGALQPGDQLAARLQTIPPVAHLASGLRAAQDGIRAWALASPAEGSALYQSLVETVEQFAWQVDAVCSAAEGTQEQRVPSSTPQDAAPPGSGISPDRRRRHEQKERDAQGPLQVDASAALSGQALARRVGTEVARMAELALRLSPRSQGHTALAAYRVAFVERYGVDGAVPLIELLDPNFGLGLPHLNTQPPLVEGSEERRAARDRLLIELAVDAHVKRERTVHLRDETLQQLETPASDHLIPPHSLELAVSIATASATALDHGDFELILSPIVGSLQAGRYFGRFASLLGEDALAALRSTARQEEALTPGALWAEVTYLHPSDRSNNVAIRPLVRGHEIAFEGTASVAQADTIPLDELVVGLERDRFHLYWPRHHAEVIPCAGHMLNTLTAPALVRFLDDIGRDHSAPLAAFDWGAAELLPFLPRMQTGRFVLTRARWHLTASLCARELPTTTREAFGFALPAWRERWNVPRYVYLAFGDNRLLLDLEAPRQAEELRAEGSKLVGNATLLIEEAYPTPQDAWVPGPGGHFATEFVFPLIRREDPSPLPNCEQHQALDPVWDVHHLQSAGRRARAVDQRLYLPGSNWLYAKFYCGAALQEGVITGSLRAFACEALRTGIAEDWFFLRYADPEAHIRVRFRGDRHTLLDTLLPMLCDWGEWLVDCGPCRKFALDAYERETERYGGPAGVEVAEALFGADSRAVADLLTVLTRDCERHRTLLAVLSADQLLDAVGLRDDVVQRWRQDGAARQQAAASYRALGVQLQALLADPQQVWGADANGRQILAILAQRGSELAPLGQRLSQLAADGTLQQPLHVLAHSYLHLHCNRLLGIDHPAEREIIGLLLRTRESLAHRQGRVDRDWAGAQSVG